MSIRSKNKTSAAIASQGKHSIMVRRSNKHFEAQVLSPVGIALAGATTKASASAKKIGKSSGNRDGAKWLGTQIAEILKKLKITDVAFNRSGLVYHGRVTSFVDGLREAGVQI